jgi:hypothetical protein
MNRNTKQAVQGLLCIKSIDTSMIDAVSTLHSMAQRDRVAMDLAAKSSHSKLSYDHQPGFDGDLAIGLDQSSPQNSFAYGK